MLDEQIVQCPCFRKNADIRSIQPILVYADLHRNTGFVLLVADSIQQGFP